MVQGYSVVGSSPTFVVRYRGCLIVKLSLSFIFRYNSILHRLADRRHNIATHLPTTPNWF